MSPCDQPSIIHTGTRANALHVAAAAGKVKMAELILDLVTDPSLTERMYPNDSQESRAKRQEYLLDLYLNMPKKGDFDTPLHQAAKWGHWEVVKLLVEFSSCDTKRLNRENQTPAQVSCSRMSKPDADFKKKIIDLLSDRVYIPVYRAIDQSLPGFIGEPWSPSNSDNILASSPSRNSLRPPSLNPMWSPMSPRTRASPFKNTFGDSPLIVSTVIKNLDSSFINLEHSLENSPIRSPISFQAFMGPLSPIDADKVKNEWKKNSPSTKLMRLTDPDKGLERQGRQLAKKFGTNLVEYWSFLDAYCDLSTSEGLQMLECHLQNKCQSLAKSRQEALIEDLESDLANLDLGHDKDGSFLSSAGGNKNYEIQDRKDLGVIDLLKCTGQDNLNTANNNVLDAKTIQPPISQYVIWNQPRNQFNDSLLSDSSLSNPHQRSNSTSSSDSFLSAMSSINDDDSVLTAEEGSWVYIEGDRPSKTDVQVFNILDGSDIDSRKFPGIYTWKSLMVSTPISERSQWKQERKQQDKNIIPTLNFDD
jgi:hypothetical protein